MSEVKNMKFEDALKALREGKKIRRDAWTFFTSILYVKELNTIAMSESMRNRGYTISSISIEDLLAEDWEIVDE